MAPPGPKVYGTPTGYQPPDPNRQQKKATPGSGKDYLAHMIDAHNRFHASSPKQQVRPRGSSSYDAKGNYKPPAAKPPLRIEKALKDAGA